MNKVESDFKHRAVIRGGLLLFSKEDAIAFVSACEKNDIQILGIDGFYVADDRTQPSMENSIDYSSSDYRQQLKSVYSFAIRFLEEKDEDLLFEIICSE